MADDFQYRIYTTIFIWSVFYSSILLSHAYQKIRIYKSDENTIKIRYLSRFNKFIWTTLIIIGPAVLVGIRHYDVGADTMNNVLGYMRDGYSYSLDSISRYGYLFQLIRYISFHITSGNPTLFLFFLAYITLYILVRGLDKWINELSLPMALFVFYSVLGMQLMNQSRQMLALSILLYAVHYLAERKFLRYCLIITIASLIHFTAIIGLLFPFLYFNTSRYYPLKKLLYYSLWLITPLILPQLLSLFMYILPDAYSHYVSNVSSTGIGMGLVLNILPVMLPIIIFKRYLCGKTNDYFVRIAILVLPFRLAGYYSYYLMRLQYYSMIFMLLITSTILKNINNKLKRKIVRFGLIGIHLSYFLVTYVYLNDSSILPYRTIFGPY
jgi:hypothetical protein